MFNIDSRRNNKRGNADLGEVDDGDVYSETNSKKETLRVDMLKEEGVVSECFSPEQDGSRNPT